MSGTLIYLVTWAYVIAFVTELVQHYIARRVALGSRRFIKFMWILKNPSTDLTHLIVAFHMITSWDGDTWISHCLSLSDCWCLRILMVCDSLSFSLMCRYHSFDFFQLLIYGSGWMINRNPKFIVRRVIVSRTIWFVRGSVWISFPLDFDDSDTILLRSP